MISCYVPPSTCASAAPSLLYHCERAMLARRGSGCIAVFHHHQLASEDTRGLPNVPAGYLWSELYSYLPYRPLSTPNLLLSSPNARSVAASSPPVHDPVQTPYRTCTPLAVPLRLARSGQARPCYVTFVAEAEGKGTSFPSQLIMRGLSLALAEHWQRGTCPRPDTVLYHQQLPLFWRTPFFSALDSVVYILYFMLYIYTCYSTVSLTAHIRSCSLCDAPGVSAAVRHARQLRRHDAVLRGPSPRCRR
jgi:hypothetical protein